MPKADTSYIDSLAEHLESQGDHDSEVDEFTPVPYHEIEVDDFPLAVFPAAIRQFVEETADSGPCPRDFAALSVLAVAGGLIGGNRSIEAKGGFRQYAPGWCVLVGTTGSGKSNPLHKAMQPVIDIQTSYDDEYQKAKEKYDIEFEEWKADKKNNLEPTEPKSKTAYVSDSTFEALTEVMREEPNQIAYWDELAGWITSMNQYRGGAGADKTHYLSMWSFTPVNVRRMNRKLFIREPRLAIVGGIQPEVLTESSSSTNKGDGFLDRMLFTFPKRMKQRRSDVELSKTTESAWKAACGRLYEMKRNSDGTPVVMKMTDDARTKYNAWQDDHFKEVNGPDFPDRMEGVWSKMRTHMLRLALTVHMLRVVSDEADDGEIDEKSILAAAELVDYFKSHAKKVYELFTETNEDKRVRSAIQWLKRREGHTASHRDIQMNHVSGIKKASEAKELMKVIAARGHAEIAEGGRGTLHIKLVSDLPHATTQQTQQ